MFGRDGLFPKKIAIAVAILPLFATSVAAAEAPGPYVQLGVGASFLEGLSARGPNGREVQLNQNAGAVGTGAIGYALGNGFRGEFEIGYRTNDAKNVTLPSGANTPTSLNLKADARAVTYMANGYYDFVTIFYPWQVYLGAGVGAASVRVSNIGHADPFAFQLMAGVEYPISRNLVVSGEYRFLGTDSLNFRDVPLNLESHANYYDHAVMLNLRWKFDLM